eukprot:6333447-Prorocentrum_lima.AAC.1
MVSEPGLAGMSYSWICKQVKVRTVGSGSGHARMRTDVYPLCALWDNKVKGRSTRQMNDIMDTIKGIYPKYL